MVEQKEQKPMNKFLDGGDGHWYWMRKTGDSAVVRKYDKAGTKLAEYTIAEGRICSCPQMVHRGEPCKHVKMLHGELAVKPVPVAEARELMAAVRADLADMAEQVVVPDEWAEKTPEGLVKKLRLRVFGPKHELLHGALLTGRGGILVEVTEVEEW